MLLNDGTLGNRQFSPSLAPYKPVTPDYAVEAEIWVIQENDEFNTSFGLVTRANDKKGYAAGVAWNGLAKLCYLSAWDGYGYVGGGNAIRDEERCKAAQAFKPGTDWHKYRVEVKANVLTLVIDGSILATVTDNKYLSPGRVGIWSVGYQLELRNFKVVSFEQHAAVPQPADPATNLALETSQSDGVADGASGKRPSTYTPSPGDGVEPPAETPSTGGGAGVQQPDPGVVRDVQQKLQRLGFRPGPVDGIWGGKTEEAVKSFQRGQGLEATGAVDQKLLAALDAATSRQKDAGHSKEVAAAAASTIPSTGTDQSGDDLISGVLSAISAVMNTPSGQGHKHKHNHKHD